MTSEESRRGEWTKREREAVFLEHLERRRGELATAMWQAPALLIAAQAFLLTVITDRSISAGARAVVLAAGFVATLAAVGALLRLREREVRYSDAIAYYAAESGILDPRPDDLKQKPLRREGWAASFDKWLRDRARSSKWPAIHHAWSLALLLFAVADLVAFACTT